MIVLGMGRVGGALVARARARGVEVAAVDRRSGDEALSHHAGPILVCTRNDDLDDVLRRVPERRHSELVLVQNGMLRDWVAARGLAETTRGLLFFAVSSRGAPLEPGPPSPFTGPRASAVVAFLHAIEVPAEVVDAATFGRGEVEKLLWNVCFGLVCDLHKKPVGDVVTHHRADLAALVTELLPVAEASVGVTVALAPLVDRMCAYSLQIPRHRAAVKAWSWRNGWFVDAAKRQGIVTPVHDRMLRATGHARGG